MASTSTAPSALEQVGLLEAAPDLGRYVSAEERSLLARVPIPTLSVGTGRIELEDIAAAEPGVFGLVIVEGMLARRQILTSNTSLRLLGAGALLSIAVESSPEMLGPGVVRALSPTRFALLGERTLLAARRVPRLLAGLHDALSEQNERTAAQMTICQMPRVEDRVLAMFWLLAESWGRVTKAGTTLPMTLTHDTIGELVGARRSTVTLALRELSERGAVLRQDDRWLLLERLPPPSELPGFTDPEIVAHPAPSSWAMGEHSVPESRRPVPSPANVLRVAYSLRLEHRERSAQLAASLARSAQARHQSRQLRQQIRRRRRPDEANQARPPGT